MSKLVEWVTTHFQEAPTEEDLARYRRRLTNQAKHRHEEDPRVEEAVQEMVEEHRREGFTRREFQDWLSERAAIELACRLDRSTKPRFSF